MTIVLVGLNHETAPVELRECFYLSDEQLRRALDLLWYGEAYHTLNESVIISTCNRLELYAVADHAEVGFETLTAFLADFYHVDREQLGPALYFRDDRAAIDHLMRVATGLNSLVLGETQILGQVANALAAARAAETVGAHLTHLFNHAIHAGKRAHTETNISRNTMSVSHTAARLAEQTLGQLDATRALVVGAGEMAELAARALQMHGAQNIEIVSRTYHHAEALAQQIGVSARDWSQLTNALMEADLVIAATGAPHSVIHVADVEAALASQPDRPRLLIDIAVPRDIDDAVRALPRVTLYDIDDLQVVVDHHHTERRAAVEQVEAIIAVELDNYLDWLNTRQVVPTIVELRQHARALADAELEQALRRIEYLDEHDQKIIQQMVHRIVNKFLHAPTAALKAKAADDDSLAYAAAVRELFALDDENTTPNPKKVKQHG